MPPLLTYIYSYNTVSIHPVMHAPIGPIIFLLPLTRNSKTNTQRPQQKAPMLTLDQVCEKNEWEMEKEKGGESEGDTPGSPR